jgi:hypothetical protein
MSHKYKVGNKVKIRYYEDILSPVKSKLDETNWIVIITELLYSKEEGDGDDSIFYRVGGIDPIVEEKCIEYLVTEEHLTRPVVNRFELLDFED